MSKTEQALALVAAGTHTVHGAAVHVGMKPNTLYVAIKRRRDRGQGICPACGQDLKLAWRVGQVLTALDRTAEQSQSQEKRAICADIAKALRGA
jgi:transposase-like protein